MVKGISISYVKILFTFLGEFGYFFIKTSQNQLLFAVQIASQER